LARDELCNKLIRSHLFDVEGGMPPFRKKVLNSYGITYSPNVLQNISDLVLKFAAQNIDSHLSLMKQ
jgi:hypothetical protein